MHLITEPQDTWSKNCQDWRRDSSTIIVGGINIPLLVKDKTTTQKIKMHIEDLNIINKLGLIDICRTPHPTTEYTFFSNTDGTLSKIDHISGHKASISKF